MSMNVENGWLVGEWKEPRNLWQHAKGGVHDDEAARKFGLRGGTVPGTVHLNHFAPLLVATFGQRWFETGCLSMFYVYATMDREQVRAVVEQPAAGTGADVQVRTRIENAEGRVVAEGTASVGNPAEPSHLVSQTPAADDHSQTRLLAWAHAGYPMQPRDVEIAPPAAGGPDTGTDQLDWYRGTSPWGGPILGPSAMFGAMQLMSRRPDGRVVNGFYGGTEIRLVAGPVRAGVPYRAHGKMVHVGSGGRTEYYWYDSQLDERDSGRTVARMRHICRFFRNDPRWQDWPPAGAAKAS
jgi:hypothetical protein